MREDAGGGRAGRPAHYSRAIWPLLLALDLLPWPWGEEILARIFVVRALVYPPRLRRALRWAASTADTRRQRLALALASCAHHGRAVARSAVLGLADPGPLRPYLEVRGGEHLAASPGATILLGFHVGMPNSDVVLRLAGHALTWVGGTRASPGWMRPAWRALAGGSPGVSLSQARGTWGAVLRRVHQILLDGEAVYMTADGLGREAFRLALPGGGVVVVRSGWLALAERTNAAVLPVLSHRQGRMHVVTIHPPLPGLRAGAGRDRCREVLQALLADYARRFPEQCYTFAFPV